jgi:hypothetical protein
LLLLLLRRSSKGVASSGDEFISTAARKVGTSVGRRRRVQPWLEATQHHGCRVLSSFVVVSCTDVRRSLPASSASDESGSGLLEAKRIPQRPSRRVIQVTVDAAIGVWLCYALLFGIARNSSESVRKSRDSKRARIADGRRFSPKYIRGAPIRTTYRHYHSL